MAQSRNQHPKSRITDGRIRTQFLRYKKNRKNTNGNHVRNHRYFVPGYISGMWTRFRDNISENPGIQCENDENHRFAARYLLRALCKIE